jgi:hypothetical protein
MKELQVFGRYFAGRNWIRSWEVYIKPSICVEIPGCAADVVGIINISRD